MDYPITLNAERGDIGQRFHQNNAAFRQLSHGADDFRMSGMADGYSDPEIKALLKEFIVLAKQKQNVNLTVEDGKSFPAYIMAYADQNRVEANERQGVARRRLRR